MSITNNDSSLLTEFETTYVRASSGSRLANLFIDNAAFNILSWLFEITIAQFIPQVLKLNATSSINILWELFINLCLFVVFISAQEAVFHGKTIGKFITGTKAVNLDGTAISGYTAFLRSLARAVPFEPFSALGSPPNPWHDKWTNTMVIDERRSADLSLDIEGQ